MIDLVPKMTVAIILIIVEEITVIVAVIGQMTETIIAEMVIIVRNQEMTEAVIPAAETPIVEISGELKSVDKIIIEEVTELMTETVVMAIIVLNQKMAEAVIAETIIEKADESMTEAIIVEQKMAVAVVAVTIVEKIIEEPAETEIGVVEEQLKITITIDL